MFHIATPEEIKSGKVTDAYFVRTMEILKARRIDKRVKAEFVAKGFPAGWEWAVFAGIEEALEVLKELSVNVRAMEEGALFRPYQPVLEIEGMYSCFGHFETAILGLLCQASGVATKAARCKKLAGERSVLSFGGRRVHPAIAPMVERNAFIGGCDGVAIVKSGEIIQKEAVGTMPHALVILMGNTLDAVKAFQEVVTSHVRRIALIDTFSDEKFEAIRLAEAMGQELFALRLDTPSSRRGDFYRILEEVRWELDLRGYDRIRLFVSGGLNEKDIVCLNPIVSGYGIGTAISNAPVIDFSMDIVEVDGKPLAKRGKISGSKRVLRCSVCRKDTVSPLGKKKKRCDCGGNTADLITPLLRNGRLVRKPPSPQKIRSHVLTQLKDFPVNISEDAGTRS